MEQAEELNSAPKTDLFALRDSEASKERSADRVLKSLTVGRGKIATTSPQYKTAMKAMDKFIDELKKYVYVDSEASPSALTSYFSRMP